MKTQYLKAMVSQAIIFSYIVNLSGNVIVFADSVVVDENYNLDKNTEDKNVGEIEDIDKGIIEEDNLYEAEEELLDSDVEEELAVGANGDISGDAYDNEVEQDLGSVDVNKMDEESINIHEDKSIVEDNWLNREVSKQVFGDEEKFTELTDSDYEKVTEINLNGVSLNSTIPKEVGYLNNLKTLYLQDCSLSGNLPDELYNLNNLISLDISNNNISGQISSDIKYLAKIRYLFLSSNELSGGIPSEVSLLTNLDTLDFSSNNISGQLPTGLGNLKQLKKLYGAYNNLTGDIPRDIYDCESLEALHMHENTITGSISPDIKKLTKLVSLSFNNNSLTGIIPVEIGNLSNLETLYLRSNNLSGIIPAEMGNLSNLKALNLSFNKLTGTIPSTMGNLSNLETLYLQSNLLNGDIPLDIYECRNLKAMYLDKNKLTGAIPKEIGNLMNLLELSLSNNLLSGELPSEIGNLKSLEILYIASSGICGEIPSELYSLVNLKKVNLSYNNLTGSISEDIYNLRNIDTIFLNYNNLSGNIPKNLSGLSKAEIIRLDNNNLCGEIPSQIGNLTFLKELYLYNNSIEGSIPASIGNLSNLEVLNIHSNKLSGVIPESIGNLSKLTMLALASNDLTGKIPDSVTRLVKLKQLFLQENYLTGSIPSGFESFVLLERLDMSNNYLTGIGESFPDNFKTTNILKGNFIDGILNQKQLTFLDSEGIDLSLGEGINLDAIIDSLAVSWGGVNYPYYRPASIELILDEEFFNKDGESIKSGNTSLEAKIVGANVENNLAKTSTKKRVCIESDLEVEDNWLNREVSKQVFGDEEKFTELTDSDYEKIKTIKIDGINLDSEIPEDIGKLKNIEILELSHTNLYGGIPIELCNLENLKHLYIPYNELTGSIPNEIENMKNLRYFNMVGNKLSGEIPKSIGNMTSLTAIHLQENKLTGAIPNSIGNLTNLKMLSLGANQLSSSIPESIGNLTNLTEIHMAFNDLSGEIPDSFYNLINLKKVVMPRNNLKGSISSKMSNLINLEYIDLGSNELVGSIPNEIFDKCKNLSTFSIYDNQFIDIPSNFPEKFKNENFIRGNLIPNMSNQKKIVLKNTNIVELEVGDKLEMPQITKLDVEILWNGDISEISGQYAIESYLYDDSLFDKNMIAVKEGITKIVAKIKQADTSNTSAQSTNAIDVIVNKKFIPLDISLTLSTKDWTNQNVTIMASAISSEDVEYIQLPDGSKISTLEANYVVSENGVYEFKGKTIKEEKCFVVEVKNIDKGIPSITLTKTPDINQTVSIKVNCADDLSGVGEIVLPDGSLTTKEQMIYMAAWNDSFEFMVKDKAGNINKATVMVDEIVLDDTWLAKEIARQVSKNVEELTQEDFDKIKTIQLSNKGITGKLPEYIGNLTNLEVLKLNGNDIRGNIPNEIGRLEKLKTLWLNDNRLFGDIPNEIGNLSSLVSLDLGLNFISGEIPSSIGKLENIKYIYLCENKLHGEVPGELGDLSTLRDLCIDFNQLVGNIPDKVVNLGASKNFDFNFLENARMQNTLKIKDDFVYSIEVGDRVNVDYIKYFTNVSNEVYSNKPLSPAYELEFVPDEEGFFDDANQPIKCGVTTGRVKLKGNSIDNNSTISANSFKIYISDVIEEKPILPELDDECPTVEYTLSTKDWTSESVLINLKAFDNIGVQCIVLPNGVVTDESAVYYKVEENGIFEFRVRDTSDNEISKFIEISNIDKIKPHISTIKNKDDNKISIEINVSDLESGVDYIEIPNGAKVVGSKVNFEVKNNGQYEFRAFDLAGNISSTVVHVDDINVDSNDGESGKEEDLNDNEENNTEGEDDGGNLNELNPDLEDEESLSLEDNKKSETNVNGEYKKSLVIENKLVSSMLDTNDRIEHLDEVKDNESEIIKESDDAINLNVILIGTILIILITCINAKKRRKL